MVGKLHGMLWSAFSVLLLSLLSFTASIAAAECVIFGPAVYEREKGAPEAKTAAFPASEDCSGFVLKIRNGDGSGLRRVSSATVILNGDEIVKPSAFNQQVEWIERGVSLKSANELSVKLAGGPGGIITLTIAGTYLPPSVSLTAEPGTIFSGDPITLGWTSSHAQDCLIDQGIGNVGPTGMSTVFPTKSTTYTIVASGPGGTASAAATVTVTNSPPSAADDTAVTDQDTPVSIPVLANDRDRDGDILSITDVSSCAHGMLVINPDQTIRYSPNHGFHGVDTFTYIVSDGKGGSASASVAVTVNPIRISLTITHPLEGEWISSPWTYVEGSISHSQGAETGVSVNGVPAAVEGDRFVASHVELREGENILAASAIDMEGRTASASVTINAETSGDHIRITAIPAMGISPFEASLRIHTTFASSQPSLAYTGPATVEFLDSPIPDQYLVRLPQEGIYVFTAQAVDAGGNSRSDSVGIQVLNQAELDARLRTKWQSVKSALSDRDISGALRFFTSKTQGLYSDIYSAIGDKLPEIVRQMENIQFVETEGGAFKYRITRSQVFNQQTYSIAYELYFVVDKDGLWKIYRY